jgi:hypothetical protein
MLTIIRSVTLFLAVVSASFAYAVDRPMSVQQATATCERLVPEFCMSTSCPMFCSTFYSQKDQERCLSECTLDNRCQLKPLGGHDDPKNAALDAQNRDQLMACIAEKRDPEGKRSGRRMTPWQKIATPSWARLFPDWADRVE